MEPEKRKTTICVISASAGLGHVIAAEAIRKTAEELLPTVSVVHIDILDHVPGFFKKLYAGGYIYLVKKHHNLWRYIYHATDQQNPGDIAWHVRVSIEHAMARNVLKELEHINPDHVICTHFLPPQLLAGEISRGRWKTPVWVQVTDFDIHRFWVHPHMAGYFVASNSIAARAAARGIPQDLIHVTGIPTAPSFRAPRSRQTCAQELGIDPGKPTVLLMSGGHGVAQLDTLAERLLGLSPDVQVIAVAGKNKQLAERLRSRATTTHGRLVPIGFSTTVERLMAASDCIVTKAGGLTTAECLAAGIPMIITEPIPGQEEHNAYHVLESGAGLIAYDTAEIVFKVRLLLEQPTLRERMRQAARTISHPTAAQNILETVLSTQ